MSAPVVGVSTTHQTAAARRAMPDIAGIAESAAEKVGVCARVVPMRAFDPITSRTSYVGAPCKATVDSVCPACAKANRWLRMTQLREGWCAAHEPTDEATEPTDAQREILAARATLFTDYHDARGDGNDELAQAIKDQVIELDRELRELGVRGQFPPLDPRPRRKAKSTRRRDDVPDLPRKKVDKKLTVGATYANGKYQPSTFFTLTLDSFGAINRVRDPETGLMVSDGSPRDPQSYDYRRQARDTIHLARLFDRWIQNLRRAVGWNVQYFATVEPQKRGAPHLHIAIRGSISAKLLYQVTAATYVNVWWPHFDTPVYEDTNMPVWDHAAGTFTDPRTRKPLMDWDQVMEVMDSVDELEPAHTMRFGGQCKPIQILGGSEEMEVKVKYLTKYLTKSIGEVLDTDQPRVAAHYDRLHQELQQTPCAPHCGVWLRYGIVPKRASEKTQPGKCRSKAHRRDTLGLPGRRCLASGKWSGKTVPDHKADRLEFVRQELAKVGIVKPDTSHLRIAPVHPSDRDAPPRSHLVMALVTRRINERAEYMMARLAIDEGPPGGCAAPQHISAIHHTEAA
ncbi:replication initiator [Nocardia sp. NPDC005978]|uniref:replication initiator n=1 Tax=Nocardia sp. NPDC005978 TaxID=3156725 RepID=UPI0033A1561B